MLLPIDFVSTTSSLSLLFRVWLRLEVLDDLKGGFFDPPSRLTLLALLAGIEMSLDCSTAVKLPLKVLIIVLLISVLTTLVSKYTSLP